MVNYTRAQYTSPLVCFLVSCCSKMGKPSRVRMADDELCKELTEKLDGISISGDRPAGEEKGDMKSELERVKLVRRKKDFEVFESFRGRMVNIVQGLELHANVFSPSEQKEIITCIPASHMHEYIAQILGVIVALLDDPDESVQLTTVQCLLTVLESSPKVAVDPFLISLSVRLRNLQTEALKKKVKKTNVPVTEYVYGAMPSADMQKAVEKEFEMALQDRVMEETKDKKNAVEEGILDNEDAQKRHS